MKSLWAVNDGRVGTGGDLPAEKRLLAFARGGGGVGTRS